MRGKKNTIPKSYRKPKWKVGETVNFRWLGEPRKGTILSLQKNPQDTKKWIYEIKDSVSGMLFPYVGVDDSQRFANIYTKEN